MKVILKNDVNNVGRAGDLLNVKPGYARNFLFPKNLALPATFRSIKEWNHKKKLAELHSKKAQASRNEIAKKIEGMKLSFQKPSTPNKKLFGSVTAFEISKKLEESGFIIDKKFLSLKEPIKQEGVYKLQVDLGESSQANIEVVVQGESTEETKSSEPSKLSKLLSFAKGGSKKKETKETPQESSKEEPSSKKESD